MAAVLGQQDAIDVIRMRLHTMLARFFGQDVDFFLRELDRARGVMSGSFVLALTLWPVSWTPKDLDLVLPMGTAEFEVR